MSVSASTPVSSLLHPRIRGIDTMVVVVVVVVHRAGDPHRGVRRVARNAQVRWGTGVRCALRGQRRRDVRLILLDFKLGFTGLLLSFPPYFREEFGVLFGRLCAYVSRRIARSLPLNALKPERCREDSTCLRSGLSVSFSGFWLAGSPTGIRPL